MKQTRCTKFCLWEPRVSPRRRHESHGGEVYHGGGNISDTRGPGGLAALRPLTAASIIALLRLSANGRQVRVGDRQTNKRIDKRNDSAIAYNPRFCGGGLIRHI